MPKVEYTKEDKALIKKLKASGAELTGEESADELRTLSDELDAKEAPENTEAVEEEGVPNKLPKRTETIKLADKDVTIGTFFVATVKGGRQALYDYEGRRVSPAYGANDLMDPTTSTSEKGIKYINKACARNNALRRKSILPGEKTV